VQWFVDALRAHPELALFFTLAIGHGPGRLRIGSFQPGPVLACLFAGLLIARAISADAREAAPSMRPVDPASAAATEFLLGNTVFVLAHEFGHAIIRDFKVPILGLEENSADTLAAGVLILAERGTAATDADTGAYSRKLGMAAVGNVLTWRSGLEVANPDLIYWAQHDLSARRAARILCLLVGSDPARFGWLVGDDLVPEVRAENCPDEYALAEYAVLWVLRTYGRFQDGQAADPGREIRIQYYDTVTPAQARLLKRLRDAQVFEKVADFYDRAFRFPAPVTLRLTSCGTPNAYWDPDLRQLRFCYELLESLDRLSVDPTVGRAYDALVGHETIPINNAESTPPQE
jgi:hypothetical protein